MSIADWDPSAVNLNSSPLVPKASAKFDKALRHDDDRVSHGDRSPERELEPDDEPATEHGKAASHAKNHRALKPKRPLHRLATVRRQQGISLRNMARRLGIEASAVTEQEQETSDLMLSELYEWQKVLEVPVADLLVDTDGPLSPPVLERARMVKLMKTATAIMEKAQSNSLRRMVTMLLDQLLEIMPELRDVSPWHTVGQRRTLDDYGRVVERQIPDDLIRRLSR